MLNHVGFCELDPRCRFALAIGVVSPWTSVPLNLRKHLTGYLVNVVFDINL